MSKISRLHAREILDSRGTPTLEVEVTLQSGIMARAAVPSGASTGAHEACELRDQDKSRYLGKGVMKAVQSVKEIIAQKLMGQEVVDWRALDKMMLQLDGTEQKTKLGANAILGVSLACAKAAAIEAKQPLYKFIGGDQAVRLPVPLMNVLNGGAHANNGLNVQEFMIVPVAFPTFREALRAGAEIFHTLKKILNEKKLSTAVGDEGGFAPVLQGNRVALELLMSAIEKAGYKPGDQVKLALDVAATEFFADGKYTWEGKKLSSQELADVYGSWKKDFPLVSIEDGFSEDDWAGWVHFTKQQGKALQIVGDDLFVTNPTRIERGIKEGAANALLVKVNQIGSLSETEKAVQTAKKAGYKTVMSHRSGETEDTTIADLAVGMNCEQIKTGSLCRTDRTAKYNQLLRIEEELGDKAQYWGSKAFS